MKYITKNDEAKVYDNGKGADIKLLFDNQTHSNCKNLSVVECIIPCGNTYPYHYHKKTEEIYYICNGIGEILIDGKKTKVSKGDLIHLPIAINHGIKAITEVKLLAICTPAREENDVFEL